MGVFHVKDVEGSNRFTFVTMQAENTTGVRWIIRYVWVDNKIWVCSMSKEEIASSSLHYGFTIRQE